LVPIGERIVEFTKDLPNYLQEVDDEEWKELCKFNKTIYSLNNLSKLGGTVLKLLSIKDSRDLDHPDVEEILDTPENVKKIEEEIKIQNEKVKTELSRTRPGKKAAEPKKRKSQMNVNNNNDDDNDDDDNNEVIDTKSMRQKRTK
jgi:hypothetical protein